MLPHFSALLGKQLSLLEITNFIGQFPRSADLLYSIFFLNLNVHVLCGEYSCIHKTRINSNT